jgi:chromosome segregation protein
VLQFTKLRLTGFKSFVDVTDFYIEPGLTGVVGPNGCGKSNLVEALRWVMGESSAKKMRGGGMEDVIFNGTDKRPPRNVAEVHLTLDNKERTAPAQFNAFDELDICRRIERERGSSYRVNGKEVRARDVQLLFADQATGAHSTALVSQGRIGEIIRVKPQDRRILLEEAAGITGLHSRRHEAELRLRGAETNLTRLDDILSTLDGQRHNLKKQARQASRYRNLSGHIRKSEATLYFLRWSACQEALEESREKLAKAASEVVELTAHAAEASARQAKEAALLPDLRQAEAVSAAELQRLVLARESLDAEDRRINEAYEDCTTRLNQINSDMEREKALVSDAAGAIEGLLLEKNAIEKATGDEDAGRKKAENQLGGASKELDEADKLQDELTERLAGAEAQRDSLLGLIRNLEARKELLNARKSDIESQRAALENDSLDKDALKAAEEKLEQAGKEMAKAQESADEAETARQRATKAADDATSALHASTSALTGLEAEEKALADILESSQIDAWPPVVGKITVEPGYEAALGAALGEDLSAPTDEAAPMHWRSLSPFSSVPDLPTGSTPLSRFVKGPAALERRLSQIGLIEGDKDEQNIASLLSQGQRLVSRDGALWRWDGYSVSSGAMTAAGIRLEQKNKLKEARRQILKATSDVEKKERHTAKARSTAENAAEAEKTARLQVQEAQASFGRVREELAAIKEKAASEASKLAALKDAAEGISDDLADTLRRTEKAQNDRADLPDPEKTRQELSAMSEKRAKLRIVQAERQAAYTNLSRIAEERRQRLEAIAKENSVWRQRSEASAEQMRQLEERRGLETAEQTRLSERPGEITEQRKSLLDHVEKAEKLRQKSADTLAEAEKRLSDADKALRQTEELLGQAREQKIRTEGALEQHKQASAGIQERAAERLDCTAESLKEVAEIGDDAQIPEMEAVERRLERLQRERETMGPVNLRAEHEAQEIDEQITTLVRERDDLIKAIEKLRLGIAELNSEGRERLLASFKEVDRHFQDLFVRLFNGGRAHLKLIDADDPLDAGLEIMASPPGKRLQVLSLLSGGEQALTALALLFAVFLTNPAPICVLDEVDAPLDDANVDRVCSLLSEMAAEGRTRFLVITHNPMTMSRTNRLFGVTMSERGVSQLVSVDLERAEEMKARA